MWRFLLACLAPAAAYYQSGVVARYPGNVIVIPPFVQGARDHVAAKVAINLREGVGRSISFGNTPQEPTMSFGNAAPSDTLRRIMAQCGMACFAYARYNADALGGSRPTPTHYAVELAGHEALTRATYTAPPPQDTPINSHACSCLSADASDPDFTPPGLTLGAAHAPAAYAVGYDADEIDYTGVASLSTDAFDGPADGAGEPSKNAAASAWRRSGLAGCNETGTAFVVPPYAAAFHGYFGGVYESSAYGSGTVVATSTFLPFAGLYYAQTPGNPVDLVAAFIDTDLYYPVMGYDATFPQPVVPGECVCAAGFAGRACDVDISPCASEAIDYPEHLIHNLCAHTSHKCYPTTLTLNGGDGPALADIPATVKQRLATKFSTITHPTWTYDWDDHYPTSVSARFVAHLEYDTLPTDTDVADFRCAACPPDKWGAQCQLDACVAAGALDPAALDAECSAHGYCVGVQGCRCRPGWSGPLCGTWDEDVVSPAQFAWAARSTCFDTAGLFAYSALSDTVSHVAASVPPLAAAGATPCSGHGTCVRDGDTGACQCDADHAGVTCAVNIAACAEGFSRTCRMTRHPLAHLAPRFACDVVTVGLPLGLTPAENRSVALCEAVGSVAAVPAAPAPHDGYRTEGVFVEGSVAAADHANPASAAFLYCNVNPCTMASTHAFATALRALVVSDAVMIRPLIVDAGYYAATDFLDDAPNNWVVNNFLAKGGDDAAACGVDGWTAPQSTTLALSTGGAASIADAGSAVAAFDAALRGVPLADGRVIPSGASTTQYANYFVLEASSAFVLVSEATHPRTYFVGGRLGADQAQGGFTDVRDMATGHIDPSYLRPVGWWTLCLKTTPSTLGELMDLHSDTARVAPLAYN